MLSGTGHAADVPIDAIDPKQSFICDQVTAGQRDHPESRPLLPHARFAGLPAAAVVRVMDMIVRVGERLMVMFMLVPLRQV